MVNVAVKKAVHRFLLHDSYSTFIKDHISRNEKSKTIKNKIIAKGLLHITAHNTVIIIIAQLLLLILMPI